METVSDLRPQLEPVVEGRRRTFCCHRAVASGRYAGNSIEAIRECVDLDVPRLEIDVRYLRDGGLLVCHDEIVQSGRGADLPVDGMDRSAAASTWEDAFGCRPVFLEDVVETLRPARTVLQIDLKAMRPLSPGQRFALAEAVAPIRDRTLIGSQAHWNLPALAALGLRVAFDPTLHWHALPTRRPGDGLDPARIGRHGLWDDSPFAHLEGMCAPDYVDVRTADLLALVPASEWMVDVDTICHLRSLGCDLGARLARYGVELAAWTVRDRGAAETAGLLRQLFAAGVTTVIADTPLRLAAYAAGC